MLDMTQPTQSLDGQPSAQSLLAQATPAAAPPMPQYQAPTQAPQSFTTRLLQGLLSGLSGGVRGATEDMAIAGHGATQGNGAAYGLQQYQQLQNQQAQQQQAATQQAQEQFENQLKTRQASQQEQLNAQRQTSQNLENLTTAYRAAQLPKEAQKAYDDAQDAKFASLSKDDAPVAQFHDEHTALAWLQQHGKTLADYQATHQANREDDSHLISLFPQTATKLGSDEINKLMPSPDYYVPAGYSATRSEAHALADKNLSEFVQKQGTLHNAQTLEAQRAADEMRLERQKEASDRAAQSQTSGSSQGSSGAADPAIERTVEALHNHLVFPDQVGSGMGKDAASFREKVNLRALEKYPDMDLANLKQQAADAQKTGTQTSIKSARTLFGTHSTPGTLDTFEDILKDLPHSALGPAASEAEQAIAYHTGAPSMARFKAARFDVGQEAAKYLAGPGGVVTDEKAKGAIDQFQNANTESSARSAFQTLRTLMSERHRGIIGNNPYLANQAADIPDPRIARQPLVQQSHSTKRERKSYDGGKTWLETPQ